MAFYHMQMQQENIDTGQYQVTVSDRLNNRPIENARVRISYTGAPDSTIEEVTTDSSGRTPVIELKTPPLEYSMEPVEQQPYSEYTIQIEAEGFEPKEIAGSQVIADTLSRQPTTLNVMESGETFQRIVIPPHTLFYEYPPKIEEAEIKPINENGEIVLSKVVVPEYIVVHDGPVNDSAAGNYYVRYKDYIKNVASSEIYATWPDDTIRANILAIMSFTLNRVYTEWYRNKGYDFTITSSTAYDHKLNVMESGETFQRIVIPPHTLFYEYPPKIEEAEIKPINENGEIVLSKVVVPEYIVVHDGPVNDSAAGNYYVRYKDYIKNVASSEIYATWPDDTIRANILAIMSFTLNRVYTEWYRNKGYDFTITSSTAYDHKWIYGRNIFASIDRIVDELFENYLSRPNVRQPILTQYCDGKQVQCRNRGWMTQWGSKALGDQGYSAIEILRTFYGNDMYINVAEAISGIPSSWPGYDLDIGASGNKVRQIQEQLNTIAEAYPAVPVVTADGIYGPETQNSVRIFQSIFGLDQTGIVDYPTWYKIQEIYVAVSRIAELR